LLLAATVRSFAHMPLGISDRNSSNYLLQDLTLQKQNYAIEFSVIDETLWNFCENEQYSGDPSLCRH